MDSSEQEKYESAKARVAALKGFYIHAAIFAAVITLLLAVDFLRGDSWWVQWPFLGWGIGVLIHAWAVFGRKSRRTSSWEERKIRETMSKM